MDLQMPEMDGFEATAAIRAIESVRGRHTPIVALTAHAMPSDRERCRQASMEGYVAKPIRREELLAEIERVTGGSPQALLPAAELPHSGTRAVLRYTDDEVMQRTLAGLFLEDYPDRMANIRQALDADDAVALKRAAHTFKGSVGAICEQGPLPILLDLEAAGTASDLARAKALYADLEAQLALLIDDLQRVKA